MIILVKNVIECNKKYKVLQIILILYNTHLGLKLIFLESNKNIKFRNI